jgi:hypothetical protein
MSKMVIKTPDLQYIKVLTPAPRVKQNVYRLLMAVANSTIILELCVYIHLPLSHNGISCRHDLDTNTLSFTFRLTEIPCQFITATRLFKQHIVATLGVKWSSPSVQKILGSIPINFRANIFIPTKSEVCQCEVYQFPLRFRPHIKLKVTFVGHRHDCLH